LDAGGSALETLAGFDAVLIGGAATPPDMVDQAQASGVGIVTTYGMTETAGGCVYDGRPLDAVRVRTDSDGRIQIAGPTLATGGPGRPGVARTPDARYTPSLSVPPPMFGCTSLARRWPPPSGYESTWLLCSSPTSMVVASSPLISARSMRALFRRQDTVMTVP